MNKQVHRLVFDRRRGMRVPVAEHMRSAGKAAGGQTRAVALVGALGLLAAAEVALAQARDTSTATVSTSASRAATSSASGAGATRNAMTAVQEALARRVNSVTLPQWGGLGDWRNHANGDVDAPLLLNEGKTMKVVQRDGKVIVTWDSFDLGRGYEFILEQPNGGSMLSRVRNADPSIIDGVIKANGEFILENTAGVVFGRNARVDAYRLVATALKISDAVFKNGLRNTRDGSAVFEGVGANTSEDAFNRYGFVGLDSGQTPKLDAAGNVQRDANGNVIMEHSRATIRTTAGGDVILVAPHVVNNGGSIQTPQGQAILAAGQKVYLYAPLDLAQRGLVVAADAYAADSLVPELNSVENGAGAEVRAEQGGTINLVGAAIRQKGNLTATTAVKGLNGGIFIQAMKGTAAVAAGKVTAGDGKGLMRIADETGSVELAAGSVTQVLPDVAGTYVTSSGEWHADAKPVEPTAVAADATAEQRAAYDAQLAQYNAALKAYEALTQRSSDAFYRSRIDIVGKTVTLAGTDAANGLAGAKVLAPAGEVNLLATANWLNSAFRLDTSASVAKDGSLLEMGAGSMVSVQGLRGLHLPVERQQLQGRFFSIELSDSPLQRTGVLYRSEVFADARRFISVGNAVGFYSDTRRTAAEMSTVGGLLRMQSQDTLKLGEGATVAFGGGSVVYDPGTIVSSLLRKGNETVRVEDASPDVIYDAFVSSPNGTAGSSNVDAQLVGQSAGVAVLAAPVMDLKAQLDGSVLMGEQQRVSTTEAGYAFADGVLTLATESGLAEQSDLGREIRLPAILSTKPHLYASLRPNNGMLVLGNLVGPDNGGGQKTQLVERVSVTNQDVATDGSDGTVWLNANRVSSWNLGSLRVTTHGFSLAGAPGTSAGTTLQLAAGGEFKVNTVGSGSTPGLIRIDGAVVVHGGSISLNAGANSAANIELTSAASLDVSGTTRDERYATHNPNEAVDLTAGTVSLNATDSIFMDEGSLVDVTAGVWRNAVGSLSTGTAGTVSLAVNGYNADPTVLPSGVLNLGGSLRGHDFTAGGTLKVSGVRSLSIGGGTSDGGNLALDASQLAGWGFGTMELASLGHVTVMGQNQLGGALKNLVAREARYGNASSPMYDVAQLAFGRRSGVSLTVRAESTPTLTGTGVLATGADLTVAEGASIDVGAGGKIDLRAGGFMDMLGALKAQGGTVTLGLTGRRGGVPGSVAPADIEGHGYLSKDVTVDGQVVSIGQQLHLGSQSSIDVSGVAKTYFTDGVSTGRVGGSVLGGGTINLGLNNGSAVRGRLVVDEGAKLNLDGAQASIDYTNRVDPTLVSASAGTLNITSTDGFQFLGTVSAKAPNAQAAGGTLNVSLSKEGLGENVETGGNAYPNGVDPTIRVMTDAAAIKAQLATSGGVNVLGEGLLAASLLNDSGMDRIKLRADRSIELGRGVSIAAPAGRTRLQSLTLDTTLLSLIDEQTHLLQAHQVGLGNFSLKSLPVALFDPASLKSGLNGQGSLQVQAGLIEVSGNLGLNGIKKAELNATLSATADTQLGRTNGEVRFEGRANAGSSVLTGQLSYAGELSITAGQVYATTLSKYAVVGFDVGTTSQAKLSVLAPKAGSTSRTPLSALASLELSAADVTIDGVLRQPFGAILFGNDVAGRTVQKLTLEDGARLSVSGDGTLVPVGSLLNGTQWVYATTARVTVNSADKSVSSNDVSPDNNPEVADLSKVAIDKRVLVNGKSLTLSNEAIVDASAGGDIVAWEFKSGVKGSTDTYNRPNVYAILPTYGYDFAPHDTDIVKASEALGTSLKAGDQLTITTANDVLAAGTYTLLPARYGILPGAVLVSATTLNNTRALAQQVEKDDGSRIVSGHRSATGTEQGTVGGNPKQVWLLEPQAVHQAKSDVSLNSINAYIAADNEVSGASRRLAGDAGRISLVSDNAFDWRASFKLQGSSVFKAGQFDLSMANMVVQADSGQAVGTGIGVVSLAQLNALGAESILLGGTREDVEDRTVVTRKAQEVTFQADADGPAGANTLKVKGELLAVATSAVTVQNGIGLVAEGQDTGEVRHYAIQGAGAALLVGNLANTSVVVENVGTAPQGQLNLGVAGHSGGVSLVGQSVQLDASSKLNLNAPLSLQARALGLGSGRLAIGAGASDQVAADALSITGELLQTLNGLDSLQLRANAGIDFHGDAVLGSATMTRLSLDAPLLKAMKGASGEVATAKARNVILSNSSGQKASDAENGTGALQIEASPELSDGHTGGLYVSQATKTSTTTVNQKTTTTVETTGLRLAGTQVTLRSTGDVVFDGRGELRTQADATVSAARVTATSTADQALVSGGTLKVTKADGDYTLNESVGAGGKLSLSGKKLVQSGVIDIESGTLNLSADGLSDDASAVVFEKDSVTSVKGRKHEVNQDWRVATPGGKITVTAKANEIVIDGTLDASAPVMTAADNGDAQSAGTVTLLATGTADDSKKLVDGRVLVGNNARINLDASATDDEGNRGGTLRVDAQAVGRKSGTTVTQGLDSLVRASTRSEVSDKAQSLREFTVRARGTEGLSLASTVQAEAVNLTADLGNLTLASSGKIDATAAQGGVVRLSTGKKLTLQDHAQVIAVSTREGANGGDVLLASDGTGVNDGIELGAATVKADSSGDTKDGRIVMRVRRNVTTTQSGNTTTVTELGTVPITRTPLSATDSTPTGPLTLQAGQVDVEAVRVYDDAARTSLLAGKGTTTAYGLDDLKTDAASFLGTTTARADAIRQSLGLGDSSNVHVKAGVEIRSSAATFTVGSASSNLQLLDVRPGAEPIYLTVRASGNLNVDGHVSDGFTSVSRNDQLASTTAGKGKLNDVKSGDAASIRMVAGADLKSADVLATQAVAKNLGIAADKHVRTTAGSIELAASGDVRLLSSGSGQAVKSAAVYVAGRLAPALASNEKASDPSAWDQYTERGGRLSISAGGNVGTYKTDGSAQSLLQMVGNYFHHGTGTSNADTGKTAWWTSLESFRHGFGSFGGGNLSVTASGNIENIVAVAPTNGRNLTVTNLDDGTISATLKVLGGGDVNVVAGGDIAGGVYLLGRGNGSLQAGGSIKVGASNVATAYPTATSILEAGVMLGLMDGHWSLQSTGELNISHLFNPTAMALPTNRVASSTAAYFLSYSPDASVEATSVKGNLIWQPIDQTLNQLHAQQSQVLADDAITAANSAVPLALATLAPPVVHLTALQGDVTVNAAGRTYLRDATGNANNSGARALLFTPGSQADVDVYAGRDLILAGNLQMPDAAVLQLPSVSAPVTGSDRTDKDPKTNEVIKQYSEGIANVVNRLNPANRAGAALVSDLTSLSNSANTYGDNDAAGNDNVVRFAAERDITFLVNSTAQGVKSDTYLRTNRPTEVTAGRDLIRPNVMAQNFSEDDVTRVSAGRQLSYDGAYGKPFIAINGPGLLAVTAGVDVDLGTSYGVVALGGNINQVLPEQSAKILLQSGTAREVNQAEVLKKWSTDAQFQALVLKALKDSGLPVPNGAKAWSSVEWTVALAKFFTLSQERQVQTLDTFLTQLFVQRYLPSLAGKDAAYYTSNDFLRAKHEAMWAAIRGFTSKAAAIAQSDDAAEQARRSQQRAALYAQAAEVTDLAGLGASFLSSGNVDLASARVHSLAQGAGTGDTIDDSLGGIDVVSQGKVLGGFASAASDPHGFINYQNGSFRSLSEGDFLVGDQKVVVAGRGNVVVYTRNGDIDSGKGSNTNVVTTRPTRVYSESLGRVLTLAQPTLVGSGFQTDDGEVGLYAPNGEIRALDAYIRGPKITVGSDRVVGADNLKGSNNAAAPAAAPVTINLPSKLVDTAAGVAQASEAADARNSKKAADSLLTVELLGLGEEGTAAGEPDECRARRDKGEPCDAADTSGKKAR